VLLEVSDTGSGMSLELMRRAFEPFFTTKGRRGTGLGLAIVHGIVTRHRGSLMVRSLPGRGSTFSVLLPLTSTPFSNDQNPSVAMPTVSLIGLRVLVVEDDPVVRGVIVQQLERQGCRVTAESSGLSALALVAQHQAELQHAFDLVCTDLGLPGISGWEVLEGIRRRSPGTATVLITGWGQQLRGIDAEVRGADALLAKPFNATDLIQAVAAALQRNPPSALTP
jgi:CheY-like chemotaxis protein